MGKKKKVEEKKEGPTSLFILRESNLLRRLTKFLIEWPPFEYTVLLTIIANCVVLAIERPLPNGDKTELARQLVSKSFDPILSSFVAVVDCSKLIVSMSFAITHLDPLRSTTSSYSNFLRCKSLVYSSVSQPFKDCEASDNKFLENSSNISNNTSF